MQTHHTAPTQVERIRQLEKELADLRAQLRETRQACADWAQTFDAVSDPIALVTTDYRLIRTNAAYQSMFGVSDETTVGHFCFTAIPKQHGPCESCPLPNAVHTKRPAFAQQERSATADPDATPETRIYQRWAYPVLSASGDVERIVEIIKDVTEQEHMRQATSQAESLREADRLKSELLGTVSHELRSPLTMIQGYAATLLKHDARLSRAERREFLGDIRDAGDRLGVIIERLIELSRLETGMLQLQSMLVDVGRLASDAIAAAAEEDKHVGAHLTYTLRLEAEGASADAPGPLVRADPRRLREVLDHLLENARKYSPSDGNVEVVLRSSQREPSEREPSEREPSEREPSGRTSSAACPQPSIVPAVSREPVQDEPMLEICVRDSGLGIPPEHLDRIFERFHRVDTTLTREVDGLGLGLTLCKRIVALHGGEIWAESTPGEGSAFHVLLPLGDTTAA